VIIPSLEQLVQKRAGLISYLKLKVEEEDWHGCADACMDLREIEAKMTMIEAKK
jgi:hypothetical protein